MLYGLSVEMNKIRTGYFSLFILLALPHSVSAQNADKSETETIYLQTIFDDFIQHRENITLIHDIGMSIVQRIDSLFTELRADTTDTDLLRGIMVTRQYDRAILAYKNILNGDYVSDPELKLMVARHTALFEGYADAKREWDNQWDITARPYIYKHGLFTDPGMHRSGEPEKSYNLYRDPELRTILWDRRMFAYDVTYITPVLLESVSDIIGKIEEILSDSSQTGELHEHE